MLFYDYVTIRDGILRFKYAIDDRKDYIPSKEESNNETDNVIERYNLLEKSIYSLESIPVD